MWLVLFTYVAPYPWKLAVREHDFMTGINSWMRDFETTPHQARAYFRLLNKDHNTNLLITDLDVTKIYDFINYFCKYKVFYYVHL